MADIAGIVLLRDAYGESLRYLAYGAVDLVAQVKVHHGIVADLVEEVCHAKEQVIGQLFACHFSPNGAIVLFSVEYRLSLANMKNKKQKTCKGQKVRMDLTKKQIIENALLTKLLATAFEQLIWTWCKEDTLISCGFTANGPMRGTKSKHNFLRTE